MKKLAIFGLLVLLTGIPVIGAADILQSDRLMQRPEWDGAVMPSSWLDGAVTYEKWESSTVWSLGGTFITSLIDVPKLELGGRMDFMNYDPDNGDGNSGLSDIDVWGKYQVYQDSQNLISVGLLMTLPTGSEEVIHPHASGEFNLEVFGAGRFKVSQWLAAIGHLALRQNSDMDIKIDSSTYKVEGKTQWAVGGGVIYQVNPQLDLQGELNLASEAYDDYENDVQLRGGVDFKVNPRLTFRGGLSLGLADGAPDWATTFRCAYLF
jgi:hypothetical protein